MRSLNEISVLKITLKCKSVPKFLKTPPVTESDSGT